MLRNVWTVCRQLTEILLGKQSKTIQNKTQLTKKNTKKIKETKKNTKIVRTLKRAASTLQKTERNERTRLTVVGKWPEFLLLRCAAVVVVTAAVSLLSLFRLCLACTRFRFLACHTQYARTHTHTHRYTTAHDVSLLCLARAWFEKTTFEKKRTKEQAERAK